MGTSGHGCVNPLVRNGKRNPRRCVADNNSCCPLCRPAKCSADGCRSFVHTAYWRLRLCHHHGKEQSRAATVSAPSTVAEAANSGKCSSTFAARFKRTLHNSSALRCSVRGGDASGRSSRFPDGSQIIACSLHRSWYLPKVKHSTQGFSAFLLRTQHLCETSAASMNCILFTVHAGTVVTADALPLLLLHACIMIILDACRYCDPSAHSVVTASGNLVPEAYHRVHVAGGTFAPIALPFLGSPAIELSRRVQLAWSIVMSTLLYNIYFWSTFCGQPRRIINVVYNRVWRRVDGNPRFARTSVSDEQVRSRLGAPSIDCYIRRKRLIYLTRIPPAD